MIVGSSLGLAGIVPSADGAVGDAIRIRRRIGRFGPHGILDELEIARFQMPVIGEVVVQAKAFLAAVSEHDRAVCRHHALDSLEVLAVVTELDEKVWLRGERQLRVQHLVAPRTEL